MRKHGCKNANFEENCRAVRLVCEDGWSLTDAAKGVGRSIEAVRTWVAKSGRGENLQALRPAGGV